MTQEVWRARSGPTSSRRLRAEEWRGWLSTTSMAGVKLGYLQGQVKIPKDYPLVAAILSDITKPSSQSAVSSRRALSRPGPALEAWRPGLAREVVEESWSTRSITSCPHGN